MSYEQIEILVKAIALVISLIITAIIKPLIDSKISATEQAKIENYIKVAVRCAEQIYTPEEWAEKKLYVLNYISTMINDRELVKVDLTPADLDNLIEGIVYEVKHNTEGV